MGLEVGGCSLFADPSGYVGTISNTTAILAALSSRSGHLQAWVGVMCPSCVAMSEMWAVIAVTVNWTRLQPWTALFSDYMLAAAIGSLVLEPATPWKSYAGR